MNAHNARGFIFLEVMVALAILAGGIVTVTGAFRGALREERRSEKQYQAALLLEARLLAAEKTVRADAGPARSALLGPLSFDETESTGVSGGKRRQFALHWGEPGDVQSITLSTYVGQ